MIFLDWECGGVIMEIPAVRIDRYNHTAQMFVHACSKTSSSSSFCSCIIMAARQTGMILMVVVLSLLGLIQCFQPLFTFDGNSTTHRDITLRAVLRKTAEVCRDIAASEGQDFSLTIDDSLSAGIVQRACASTGTSTSLLSSVLFQTAIANMYFSNAKVDVVYALSEEHHFDDETFEGGRDVITAGVAAVKASVKLENFVAGRWTLGGICHTLQDFYSHSNWVELGNNSPYSTLIKPDQPLENLAGRILIALLMGLSQSSVLCFVIDTTGSMSDDIAEAKRVSFEIIDSKRGTQQEPSAYILVPFNDPGFGPLVMTTNADVFKDSINKLSANGGGDVPELCLSGLQLALTAAPPSSEIFVFTDAPAKDAYLKSTITALIESRKTVVTFMLTDVLSSRRRRSIHGAGSRAMSQADAQLYRDLAQASGGQAIEVTKSDLSVATTVIEDSSAGAVVTVFQVVKNPGLLITLHSLLMVRVSQSSSESSGPLASLTTAGNLRRLSLNTDNQTGSWQISVNSNSPYSVKVTGQSSVNFIFNLVEAHEGAHGDFSLKEGRPLSGGNASLLVSVTGSDTVKLTEVTLFDSSGPVEVNGSLQACWMFQYTFAMGSGNFLVTFTEVPAGDFVVRLKGEDSSSSSRSTRSSFQRQASTQIKTSSISVTSQANNTSLEPGSTISIPFTVATATNGVVNDSATGTFTVRANNDRSYTSTSPSTITIEAGSGGTANGTVTLTVPSTAASGTDVTLTIEAENAAATDINYAVLRFSVAAKVTDFTRPVCQVVSTSTVCPSSSSLCASSQWEFIANLTDGINGTGIESITIRQGNGTLNTSTVAGADGENVTVATYRASCCSQNVELTMVDKVGNVGTCVGQAKESTTAAPVTTTAVNTTSTGGLTLSISRYCALGGHHNHGYTVARSELDEGGVDDWRWFETGSGLRVEPWGAPLGTGSGRVRVSGADFLRGRSLGTERDSGASVHMGVEGALAGPVRAQEDRGVSLMEMDGGNIPIF
ncbi:hypothetical protein INR49_015414 [Caranx melampygus]|nr:hypothetical protein INR49_015414 [Caranx melampygus]